MKIDNILKGYSRDALVTQYEHGARYPVCCFWHENDKTVDSGSYSQWYHTGFAFDNFTFTSAEQWMMYCKAMLFHDKATAKKIYDCYKASDIKAMGRQVKGFDDDIWQKFAKYIVFSGSYLKFTQNIDLSNLMYKDSKCILIEASPVDKIWGVGLPESSTVIANPSKWKGTNWLGECLMSARECIFSKSATHLEALNETNSLMKAILSGNFDTNKVSITINA